MLIGLSGLILFRRRINWSQILKYNFWLILMFVYAGISISWSEIPFVSFKRWFRSTGDILIALVVLSERMPLSALESVIRRCAYVLIPFSLVLVKYMPHLGRAYASWSGGEMWTGVTLQKNSLGELCGLSIFFLMWALLREWRSGGLWKNTVQNCADVFVLVIALFLLRGPEDSYSATAVGSLMIGIILLFLLMGRENLSRSVASSLKAASVSLVLMYLLFYDSIMQIIAPALGRDETLTGRTDMWGPIIEFASRNPLFGVGYGGLWAPGNWELEAIFTPHFILANAHNGYLAIYVELGVVGLILLGLFLLAYCGRVRNGIKHSLDWGIFGICLLPMAMLQNYSEVSFFQSPNYLWSMMVFLTVVFSAPNLPTKEECSNL